MGATPHIIPMSKPDVKSADWGRWRAAHVKALRLASRLREAGTIFRRYAGKLKYHPQTGIEEAAGPDLEQAATAMRDAISAISTLASQWDEEIRSEERRVGKECRL